MSGAFVSCLGPRCLSPLPPISGSRLDGGAGREADGGRGGVVGPGQSAGRAVGPLATCFFRACFCSPESGCWASYSSVSVLCSSRAVVGALRGWCWEMCHIVVEMIWVGCRKHLA